MSTVIVARDRRADLRNREGIGAFADLPDDDRKLLRADIEFIGHRLGLRGNHGSIAVLRGFDRFLHQVPRRLLLRALDVATQVARGIRSDWALWIRRGWRDLEVAFALESGGAETLGR